MDRDALMKFVGTGMIVLPVILAIGTASLDAVAMSLFALLILQLAVLVIRPDDPIGDKIRADAEKDDPPPPR
jgi:archaellum biogenesis protein FlaJ (TadC family)